MLPMMRSELRSKFHADRKSCAIVEINGVVPVTAEKHVLWLREV